jgi:uncharacterized protein YndB with AHSA1/START domain/DNA-binding transcriptional ArsR family regulator
MDKVFKALADSSRRQLLDELFKKNGQTLSELCEHLEMTRQSVTKHLLILEEANLVVVEWHGRNKLHFLNVAPIGEIYDRWIGKYERHRIEALLEPTNLRRNTMTDTAFVYVTYIATTPEKLWEALTSSEFTEKYFFGTKIESDWQEGSSVTYSREGKVTDHGIILKCEPPRLLSYTWNYVGDKTVREQPSRVTFELKRMGATVKLTLKHENLLPTDIVDADDTFEGFNNGWPAILSNLKSLLETGNTLPPISI